jgi:hypothetical protein
MFPLLRSRPVVVNLPESAGVSTRNLADDYASMCGYRVEEWPPSSRAREPSEEAAAAGVDRLSPGLRRRSQAARNCDGRHFGAAPRPAFRVAPAYLSCIGGRESCDRRAGTGPIREI